MPYLLDRERAKAAGYTDDEIDAFLSQGPAKLQQEQRPSGRMVVDRQKALAAGYTDEEINNFEQSNTQSQPQQTTQEQVSSPVQQPASPSPQNESEYLYPITQTFKQQSDIETQSGGVNYGVDVAVPYGTDLSLPKGQYKVVSVYDQAAPNGGSLNTWDNSGWGNSVLVRNEQTGDFLRVSHLSKVNVKAGDIIDGSTFAASGNSGHTTGPHSDNEYYDSQGQISDFEKSPYAVMYKKPSPVLNPSTLPRNEQIVDPWDKKLFKQ